MPSTFSRTRWNVKIPEHIAREVLVALEAPRPELRLNSLVSRHPDMGSDILLWAQQARGFETIQTVPGSIHGDEAGTLPSTIGNYKVLSPLGSGGFATVFLAEHLETGQRHAIKLLRRQDRRSSDLIEREFRLLSALDHPAVVEVHEYGVTETEQPFYSMDYVSGLPLDAAFKSDVFSNEDLVASLVQLSDSVSYVHNKQLIHRDIKPQNVLIDTDQLRPRAHLVDFGIAAVRLNSDLQKHRLSMAKAGQLLQQTLFTEDGAIVGTPGFMAPEQFLAASDARADIYALGVTVYLLLTGRFPVDPRAIVGAWNVGAREAFDTIVSTSVLEPTAAARQAAGPSNSVDATSLASVRLTYGLNDRQQRMLNTTLLRALQSDPSLRHHDAAEFGEELATVFGLITRPSWLLTEVGRTIRRVKKWFRKTPREGDPRNRSVWFITDRARTPDSDTGHHFGSEESDDLTFGYSLIKLPQWNVIGRTAPRLWDRLLGSTGYELLQNRIVEPIEFESEVRKRGDRKDLLLFVHGYNTSFEDAIVRSAQLQADLKMAGQVICFSWPSHGRPWSYGRDAAICEESEDCFVEALSLLTSICNHQNLHILAHSMGNRLLLQACHAQAMSGRLLPFGQVIMAAPDVGQRRFLQRYHSYAGAKRRTMYSSKHDRALMGSRFLHARGRAGYIPPLLIVDDVDTIDASVHGLSLWGLNHSAFGNTRALVTDIGTLIRHDLAPELRIGLDRRMDPESGRLYWVCIP